jgi:hypothetical protein
MLGPETLTHYGYDDMRRYPLKIIQDVIKTHLEKFQEILGLKNQKQMGFLRRLSMKFLKILMSTLKNLVLSQPLELVKGKKILRLKYRNSYYLIMIL